MSDDTTPEHETALQALTDSIIDWDWLFDAEFPEEERWLIPGLIARAKNHVIVASAGGGKSELALFHIARACHGTGIGNEQIAPVRVLYLDFEMGHDDLQDRLVSFGYTGGDQLTGLVYSNPPPAEVVGQDRPRVDPGIWPGGVMCEWAEDNNIDLVVIDTYSRVIYGEENSNDTHTAWWRYTGSLLKDAGIATLRLDHEGHGDAKGRARGGSAKAADIDVGLYLESDKSANITTLRTTKARASWYPQGKRAFHRGRQAGLVWYEYQGPVADDDGTVAEQPATGKRIDNIGSLIILLNQLDIPMKNGGTTVQTKLKQRGYSVSRSLCQEAQYARRANAGMGLDQSPGRTGE